MNQKTTSYEGMFLLDAGNPDFQAASEPVRNILTRYGAEILAMKPWEERRLAYEVGGRKRGLYVLCYFTMDPLKVGEVERDCQLDERVLRTLILRKDELTPEVINAETPATATPHRAPDAPAATEAPATGAPATGAPAVEAPAAEIPEIPAIDEVLADEADEKSKE
jgi:small subunit ribosomal protein S6